MSGRLTALILMLAPLAAAADEISGEWCSPEGQSLRILGSRVIAPSGIETDGSYGRHRYEFVMPEGGRDAGTTVILQQLSEEEVLVSYGAADPVSWTRCRAVTS